MRLYMASGHAAGVLVTWVVSNLARCLERDLARQFQRTMDAETIPSSQQTTELELHISPILTNDNVDDVAFVGNAHHTNVFEEAWNQIKSHLSSSDSEKDMSSDEMDVDNNDNTMHDNKDSMQIHYSDIGGQVHSPVMKLEEGGEHPDEGTTSLDHSQTNIKHLVKYTDIHYMLELIR
ncbi:hypothetical protein CONPUDRAFT_78260 [Coniophora puteana RWD-64-598 SS2]|uniref:Uncharacterized protein n=1 Tax=Coniophora puteana (strain RWD-64-598) TaxID=741705 RepID=R7SDZ6_CONPW|nr:uncharacterized protein CONPUDRAFT_78260 [Coniophora puteana RWD-64-598 SS2]EIW74090.1 hypothetical protein CONPUDRAFT_78260 [Coniophora puteana RWD-64-598 SS2]